MNTFNKLKEIILPYFIEIYGEEFKEIIIQRMNQIEPIFYNTVESKKVAMYRSQSTKRLELTLKFLEENNVHLPDEVKDRIIKNNSTYELNEIPEAKNLLNACFDSHEYKEINFGGIKAIPREPTNKKYVINQSVEALNNLGISVNEDNFNQWVLTEEAKQVFERIDMLKENIERLDAEFNEFDKQFENLKSLIDKSNEIEKIIQQKHMLKFLQSISKYFTEADKQILDNYLVSDKKDWHSFKGQMSIFKIIGNTFYENGILEAFSSKADEKLKNPKTLNFIKKSIVENKIEYYKLIGLYKEQMNPEEFLSTNEAIKNAPKQELIDDIISKKEHYKKLADDEFLGITSSYKDNLEKINSLGLVADTSFGIDEVKNGTICIIPNTKIVNGKPESVALLFFSPEACLPEYVDTSFVHEINHAIELSLINYDDGKSMYKCGFEFLSDGDDDVRNYEGFSEVINQMIAIEVTEAMHRDGIYLFNNPNTSKTIGGTSYEHQKIFIKVFWEKFKKDIMKARVNNNLDSLFSVVGKENFEKLNEIINEYRSLPYYTMMDDIINKRTTELTEKRNSLLNDTMETWDAMINHAKQLPGYENLTGKKL